MSRRQYQRPAERLARFVFSHVLRRRCNTAISQKDCDHEVLSFWFQRWGTVTLSGERETVGQVLEAIYKYLRTSLTEDDLRELDTVPGNNDALHFARVQRANDSQELDAVVLASGFRRVDVAGYLQRFQGMRIVVHPDGGYTSICSLWTCL